MLFVFIVVLVFIIISGLLIEPLLLEMCNGQKFVLNKLICKYIQLKIIPDTNCWSRV